MAYIALSRVQGNVFFVGTVAQVTPPRIEKLFHMPPGSITIVGTVVNDPSGKLGDLHEGNPPAAINDTIRRQVKSLLANEGGDALTNRVFVIRAIVAAAKRAGISKAAFVATVQNIWDTFGTDD